MEVVSNRAKDRTHNAMTMTPCKKVARYPTTDVQFRRISHGRVGSVTKYLSKKTNATIPARPRMRGTRTW